MKATDLLSKEEIRSFTRASDLQGWWSVFVDWSLIGGSMALVAQWPNVGTVLVALALIGSRQLGLAILTHECAHYSLFATRWLNDLAGVWLSGAFIWTDLHRYRTHHKAHHLHTGSDDDPDLGLTTGFPTTRRSMLRKLIRDLVGRTAAQRTLALLAMDFGFIEYTASTGLRRASARPLGDRIATGLRNLAPVAITNGALLGLLWFLGHPELYLLWIGAWFTTFNVVLRNRSIAEHACMPRTDDPLANTRTTRVGVLGRLFLAPHHVNYHLEHHLIMAVPHWQLPALHRKLVELGATTPVNTVHGYAEVFRRVTTPVVT
ncbi:MAG: fatty acid desaturase family protein [Myxococcota bacterium]